jgi:hypothetical protein
LRIARPESLRQRPADQLGDDDRDIEVAEHHLEPQEPAPVERVERAPDQRAVDVALEEAPLVLAEQALAVQRIRQRGEAPAEMPVMKSTSSSMRRVPLPVRNSVRRSSSRTP